MTSDKNYRDGEQSFHCYNYLSWYHAVPVNHMDMELPWRCCWTWSFLGAAAGHEAFLALLLDMELPWRSYSLPWGCAFEFYAFSSRIVALANYPLKHMDMVEL